METRPSTPSTGGTKGTDEDLVNKRKEEDFVTEKVSDGVEGGEDFRR